MPFTVDQAQSRIASILDQNENASDVASTDYSLRLEFINKRERQWAEIGRWPELYREYYTTSSGSATVALPADFRFEAGFPRSYVNGQNYEFPIVKGEEVRQYSSSDNYAVKTGNPNTGYFLTFNPAPASGATVFVNYYGSPTSLASPANLITCPNPDYIVAGVIADVWEAQEDARFQLKKQEAEEILQNAFENAMTPSVAAADDRVKPIEQTRYNYRWGK